MGIASLFTFLHKENQNWICHFKRVTMVEKDLQCHALNSFLPSTRSSAETLLKQTSVVITFIAKICELISTLTVTTHYNRQGQYIFRTDWPGYLSGTL
jgi:hypothetical protein